MSTEPEDLADRLLRRYKEQREAETVLPRSPHPADRAALLAEVRRVHGRTHSKPRASFWFRMVLAGPAFALLLVVGFFVLQSNTQSPPAPTDISQEPEAKVRLQRTTSPHEEIVASAPPASKPSDILEERERANQPMEPAAALATDAAKLGVDRGREFSQSIHPPQDELAAEVKAKSTTPPILSNFFVAQTGENVTITDEDGSVYRGNLVAHSIRGAEVDKNDVAKQDRKSTTSGKLATKESQLNFQARGLNRTLNKEVVIDASLEGVASGLEGVASSLDGAEAAGNAKFASTVARGSSSALPEPVAAPSARVGVGREKAERLKVASSPAPARMRLRGQIQVAGESPQPLDAMESGTR